MEGEAENPDPMAVCPTCGHGTKVCFDFQIDTWYDEDWGPGSGGGSTGGGEGGGGGGSGNDDPCNGGNDGIPMDAGVPACGGEDGGHLGWEPVDDDEPPTSPVDYDKIDSIAKSMIRNNQHDAALNYIRDSGPILKDYVNKAKNDYTLNTGLSPFPNTIGKHSDPIHIRNSVKLNFLWTC